MYAINHHNLPIIRLLCFLKCCLPIQKMPKRAAEDFCQAAKTRIVPFQRGTGLRYTIFLTAKLLGARNFTTIRRLSFTRNYDCSNNDSRQFLSTPSSTSFNWHFTKVLLTSVYLAILDLWDKNSRWVADIYTGKFFKIKFLPVEQFKKRFSPEIADLHCCGQPSLFKILIWLSDIKSE